MSKHSYRFASLRNPATTGYVFTTDGMELWDSAYHTSYALWQYAGKYQTMGDGLTAHTRTVACTAYDMDDYCASLATFLLANFANFTDDEKEQIAYCWTHGPGERDIEFALSVKYNPDKRQWFSKDERKVSKSASKQHDKRWNEVDEWMDGSGESAFRLLRGDALDQWIVTHIRYEAIRDYVIRHDGWMENVKSRIWENMPEPKPAETLFSSFCALNSTMEMIRANVCAHRQLESRQRQVNWENEQKKTATA